MREFDDWARNRSSYNEEETEEESSDSYALETIVFLMVLVSMFAAFS
jgi:hypothetical protein